MRHRSLPVLLLLIPTTIVRGDEMPTAADRLHALFSAEWDRTMRESPTWASSLGDLRFNDRWEDLSFEAIERSHQANQDALAALRRIDASALSPADQLNYRLFEREYRLRVESHPFRWWLVPLNQRDGIQDAGSLADSLQFGRLKDYEDWLGRMRAFPEYMRQTIALMRRGAQERMIHPRVIMQRLPAQIDKQIIEPAVGRTSKSAEPPGARGNGGLGSPPYDPIEQHLFFKPFRNFPDDISPADRERLAAEAKRLIADGIVPAYREFRRFFAEEYLPACLDQVGVWQVPRGAELYAFRCREFTTTDLTPQQIHDIGLAEVKRIRAEMEEIVRQVKFDGTFAEFLEHLRTDPQFYFQDSNGLLLEYQAICKKIDPQLVKLFKRLPRMPYGVEPIPTHIAPDTTTAYYRPPAADGSRAGTYFVNLYRPEVRPKYEIEALSLHEAVPGHHLQISLAQELDDLPEFRRYGGYTAYVEGWALYAESLGGELGLYADPYSKFGQLTYEMWRAVRLVVDTGIHHFRWTRQQAIDVFAANTARTLHEIENEVDRYIAWPGQALAYKIGELKIKQLRARAERALGDRFDVRAFHDLVLRQGAVPLDTLEVIVDEWLARQPAPAK